MTQDQALHWLFTAQDISPNGGIAAYFNTTAGVWHASYPEVSGYVIPTFIRMGAIDRAIRISHWLRKKQLADGSMPMGYWESYIPFLFDTGMAIRGWQALQKTEYDARTAESIERAIQWIERTWKAADRFDYGFGVTHNIRILPSLKDAGSSVYDELRDFYLSKIGVNGFPREAEAIQPETPLSHFIVYIARGLFEIDEIDMATRIMDNLPGIPVARYHTDFTPASEEICVPAVAQAAVLNAKLGDRAKAQRAVNYLGTLSAPWASDPIDGEYMPHSQLSWCAKFMVDAWESLK